MPTLIGAMLFPAGAMAQTDPAAAEDEESEFTIEEVIVTGTRIPRRDYESPSPVSTLDQLTIEFSGQPTLEETLNQMPQVQPDFGRTSNNPGNGTSRINLRGLGSNRTLVMLNGRRLAPSGAGSSVDVNTLPQALIERVEIITGGASTVYGSDAIAGVVNFITVQDFEGATLEASYYITEEGDSAITDINGAWGTNFSDGRGNATLFLGYLDREESFAADRAVSAVPFRDDFQGNLEPSGSAATPDGVIFVPQIDLGNGPRDVRFDENGNLLPFNRPDDLYNFAPINYLQTPLTRYTSGLMGSWEFTDAIEGYTEITFTRNEASQTLAPTPAFLLLGFNLGNPFLSDEFRDIAANQLFPVAPGVAGFGLSRRLVELGPRVIETERDYLRAVAGLRGSLGSRWNYDAWAIYTDGDELETLTNGLSLSRFQQGLFVNPATGQCFNSSDGCVPVNVFASNAISPEAAEFIRSAPLENVTKREQKLFSAYVSGSPFDGWAGAIDMAFGVEWRSDSVSFSADEDFASGDAIGYAPNSAINGEESVWEVYGEAVIPLIAERTGARYLGLELGARYSDYDNAGSVDTWKVGVQWEVVDGVRFRSIFQRSVRAPDLRELFTEQVTSFGVFVGNNTTNDPCSASANPVENGNRERCILQGIPADQIGIYEATPFFPAEFIFGGNTELVPEEADTFTAGVVLTLPSTPNLQLAIDYFDLQVEDTIGGVSSDVICFDPNNTENLFCENIERDPNNYSVNRVVSLVENRGASTVEGIDTQITWTTDLPDWAAPGNAFAELRMNLIWTHLISKEIQENPVTTSYECAGYFGWPCDASFGGETFPENRITTNFLYGFGEFDANLTWRWIDGSENAAPIGFELLGRPEPIVSIPTIGTRNYFDLGLGYDFTDNVRGVLNVVNLFNEEPPFVANQSFNNNADTTLYDIFGRSYQASVFLRF